MRNWLWETLGNKIWLQLTQSHPKQLFKNKHTNTPKEQNE